MSGDGHVHPSASTILVDPDSELFARLQAELGSEYVLERELGRGGMAVVYLGRDTVLGRKVAVKVLPPELTFGTRGLMTERFKREAQTAARLDHPNIIPVYRVAHGGTLFWYVMKYLDGETLERILEREQLLALERTVDIVRQVADGLEYAHQNHVVHRDVKPANVVVDFRGRVTVTDFGIAKAQDASTLTASGMVIGTPHYMSPEQCRGVQIGPAADQYSLAVMTYQMLGGHLPFTGETAVEVVHKQVADPVPPLGFLRPQLPVGVIDVVERGLAKAPEQRFPTVTEFARRLQEEAEGRTASVPRPPASAAERAAARAAAAATAERARRRRRLAVDTALAALLVAGAAVALNIRGGWTLAWPPGPDAAVILREEAPAAEAPVPLPRHPQTAAPARRAAGTHPPPAHPAAIPAREPATAAVPKGPAAKPEQAAPLMGWISVRTNPRSTIYLNDSARRSPVEGLPVPAGTLHLRFMDTAGAWFAHDTTVTVVPGARLVLGTIRLVRP
ncbi:MAG TPA: serine/threonine-protein kinase [Gemmatimonadales bacterium]|nr:serine/threonine-protein kinase [Gemmatimonadales bacterium]